ncbi:MAG: hypothetical protein PQJ48_11045 [Sphaerochaetaceae bacterium]|nr:hypothetical protein [Sphaerochaetaceae bacterium]
MNPGTFYVPINPENLKEGLFSSMDLALYLGKSQAMAKKVLSELQKKGMVEKVGRGPATRFRFIS